MGEKLAGQSSNTFLLAGFTIFLCVLVHLIYKIFLSRKKNAANEQETENILDSNITAAPTPAVTEKKDVKSKKRPTQWKGKKDFSHPWLLKSLKGHPGTVLHMDFSANGKFIAAVCDERRRKQRDRRRPSASPPPTPRPGPPPQTIPTEELVRALRPQLLSRERMWAFGYPVEMEPNSGKASVYIHPPPRYKPQTVWDVNVPEFVPGGGSQSDSGRGSWGSTPRSDSDEEADTVENLCVRCDKLFRMTRDGEYLSEDPCLHHWGRLNADRTYSCCDAQRGSRGCHSVRFHVWNGTKPGMNGPLGGYVRARSPRGGVFALDTEMCYTRAGLELASIVVIAPDGRLVYRALVKPSSPVIDHNTRFSGIRPRDLARATKTLRDVQNDILGFVGTDTILIGHALENDLRALKLLHGAVVDTCALYPHERGFPMRRSLRSLAAQFLSRSVQQGSGGHSPLEDARAAMDLVLVYVHTQRARIASMPPARAPEPYHYLRDYNSDLSD